MTHFPRRHVAALSLVVIVVVDTVNDLCGQLVNHLAQALSTALAMSMIMVCSKRMIVIIIGFLYGGRSELHVHGHGAMTPQGVELWARRSARRIPGGARSSTFAAVDDL